MGRINYYSFGSRDLLSSSFVNFWSNLFQNFQPIGTSSSLLHQIYWVYKTCLNTNVTVCWEGVTEIYNSHLYVYCTKTTCIHSGKTTDANMQINITINFVLNSNSSLNLIVQHTHFISNLFIYRYDRLYIFVECIKKFQSIYR